MRWLLLISVLAAIASGCAGGPIVPTTATTPTSVPAPSPTAAPSPAPGPSTRGNPTLVYMILNDVGQGAHGDWRYQVTVHLSETGGVKTTVTNIQFQALFASNILATETVVPVLSLPANSSSDEAVGF